MATTDEERDNIESTIQKLSATTSAFNRKNLMQLGSNLLGFFRFYGEVLTESVEAESYPIYFLPSLVIILCLGAMLGVGTFNIVSIIPVGVSEAGPVQLSLITRLLLAIAVPFALLFGFALGLKISALIFKSSSSLQDLVIAMGIFSAPLFLGVFFYWLFMKIAAIVAIFLIFAAHSTALLALYAALPKVLLMKGLSRFLTILTALASAIFIVGILLRIVL